MNEPIDSDQLADISGRARETKRRKKRRRKNPAGWLGLALDHWFDPLGEGTKEGADAARMLRFIFGAAMFLGVLIASYVLRK